MKNAIIRMVNAVTTYIYTVKISEGRAISTWHSRGCIPITGYKPEDYESDPYLWHSMIHPDDRIIVESSIEEILKGNGVPLMKKLVELRKMLDELQEAISEFQKAEEQIQEKIIEYEKLSALGRLTANVAHEIRNPITVIGGLTKRLKKSISHEPKEQEYLEGILSEVRRLEEILKDVLVFSDKAFFKREMKDINKIVEDSLNMYEDACKNASIYLKENLGDVPQIYIPYQS